MVLTAASLLIGPATLLHEGFNRPGTGQSLVNLLSLSFRPHVPLSFLFMFGFTAASLLPVIAQKTAQAERGAAHACFRRREPWR